MNRRWLVNKTNREFLEYLSKKASISTAFAQVLVNRGVKDAESIKKFLSPSLEHLHDPFLMPDMDKAVERIKSALHKGETVLVHGDYDADGITSTALLVSALRMLGLKTYYYIPNRAIDGYGLSKTGIKKAESLGASLIITVDCGISSKEEVSIAVSIGIDIIITDHHEPPKELPVAKAIINPHRTDSKYPFKELAGVGVAYKLAQALFREFGVMSYESRVEDFLDLAAIGTIGDSVPLIGENRILVAYGLKVLNSNNSFSSGRLASSVNPNVSGKPWINLLKEMSGMGVKEFHSGSLSYTIVPRINAVGRLSDANEVVELFLTNDTAKAKGIAYYLEEQNRKRQTIEGNIYKSALNMIDSSSLDNAIVLYSPDWHLGVIGIIASRIAEMFYRPTFLFSVKGDIAKGSARSIPPFHIYKGIAECEEFLIGFGGHSQAAGLRLHTDNLHGFKEKINRVVQDSLNSDDLIPTVEMDGEVELPELNFNLLNELSILEPFGNSNPEPVFGAKEVEIIEARIVGNNHLKMKIKQKSTYVDTIGFDMGNLLEQDGSRFTVHGSRFVDVAFVPSINQWNGNKSIQLNVKALRPSL